MPDDFFISTRTPGSRTSTYGLADHLADPDPHHQYLFRSEFTESGELTDGKLELHNRDLNAHDGYLAKVSDLTRYVQINNFATELANHLYHDYTDPEGSGKTASIKAVHDAYVSLNTVISTHRTGYAQGSSTDHKDNTNQELYAHRVHTHTLEELGGATSLLPDLDKRYSQLGHNHDDRYALITHYHNYLAQSDLESVGIYPNTTIGIAGTDTEAGAVTDPFDFNDETQQGNVSISPTVMTSALNKPDITTPSAASFLNITTEITSADKEDDSGTTIYGERYVSQSLTTDNGIYYRIGHRASGSLAENQDESALWTWSDWQPVGGGSKDIFEVFYSTSVATPRGAFPLWTGETITDCKKLYPTFYQKALEYRDSGKIRVVTSTVYEQELTTYGECGAFVIDESTGNIRLPKITRFISSLDAASDIGITKNDSVGNHAHPYAGNSVGGSTGGSGMGVYRDDVDPDGGLYLDEGGGKQIYYTRKDGIINGNVIHVNRFTDNTLIPKGRANNVLSVEIGEYIWIPYSIDTGIGAPYKGTMWKRTQVTTGVLTDDYEQVELATVVTETSPKHVRLALYIQVYNSITATAITDLDARVGVLEQNAIMFARHDFTASQWDDNSDGTFTYTFNTNHFTSSHIYMNETGGSVLVDESVEVHIEGPTETDASSRKVRLVSPQRFSGYIITLG